MSIWHKIKCFFTKYCTLVNEISPLIKSLENIESSVQSINTKIALEMRVINAELERHKSIVETMAETVPDMFWIKDLEGKYLYANIAIRTDLLCESNPIGMTDVELAKNAKAKYGDTEHTFGDKCFNSDLIVQNTLEKQRFLESGKVRGKMLYLEVFKRPLFSNGHLIGICGIGRDMTPYIEAYRKSNCNSCGVDIFKQFEYGEDQN